MKKLVTLLLVLWALLGGGVYSQPALGNLTVKLFDADTIRFREGTKDAGAVIRLAEGRMLLKRIKLPAYQKDVQVRLNVELQSAGDAWDKSGSLFVVPKASLIHFLTIARQGDAFPSIPNNPYPGIVASGGYQPVVELMRFMTPFGVGHYSHSKQKPVYIPRYADKVEWQQDVTDRLSLLQGDVYVGVWIDTWTDAGYKLSAQLHFSETRAKHFPLVKSRVLPLTNTVAYGFGQRLPDFFATRNLEVPFRLPSVAKNVRLAYIVTGHGGHSGGDEFTPQENILRIDGQQIHRFTPWREDCASFRRFNPTSGVWLRSDTATYIGADGKRASKVIEERIASSDLSRSNWCSGSDVQPVVIPLPHLQAGNHVFSVSIPNAQPATDGKMNHWLVSAYLYWEE